MQKITKKNNEQIRTKTLNRRTDDGDFIEHSIYGGPKTKSKQNLIATWKRFVTWFYIIF